MNARTKLVWILIDTRDSTLRVQVLADSHRDRAGSGQVLALDAHGASREIGSHASERVSTCLARARAPRSIHRSKASSNAAYGRGLGACSPEAPQEQDPSSRHTEKLSSRARRRGHLPDSGSFRCDPRRLKALLIHVQPAMRGQVTGRGHHDPGDPMERRLPEALLTAVLRESFTLDRVRRDRAEHESRRLHEQLLET